MSGVSGQYLLSRGFGVVLNHTTSRGTERMSMDRSVVGVVQATLRKQRVVIIIFILVQSLTVHVYSLSLSDPCASKAAEKLGGEGTVDGQDRSNRSLGQHG